MVNYKLSIVQKISLAGIFIVLVALFQKIFAVNYIAIIPFVRISFGGPALIIFSSVLLGPWFGLMVGAFSDIIGFYIFDPKMFGAVPFFQITAIYALLGFSAYWVFKLVNLIKSRKLMMIIEGSTFGAILLFITLFICLTNSITLYGTEHVFTTLHRILVPTFTFILLSALFAITYFIDRHFKKKEFNVSTYQVSFASFILEVFVMLIFGSVMKTWAFGSTMFIAIFFSQLIVTFFNVPLNTFLLSYIMYLSRNILRHE